jgi:hypothetical protein
MIQPEAFDTFYKDARARLLLQTYALTGDLPAARSAVRDSFIVTWHHWRKVSRLPDPEAWVRPHAWAQAQRRHTARIWHRDKTLAPETRATFDALGALSLTQRKALVLAATTRMSLADRARELSLTIGEADRQTASATEAFCAAREVQPGQVPALFDGLGALVTDTRLPRPSILRRAGAARRRTHTVVGAAAAVAAVLVTGTVVSGSTLEGVPSAGTDPGSASESTLDGSPVAAFTTARLLEAPEVGLFLDGRGWSERDTSDNSQGNGRVAPCQQERYADPKGVSTLVRTFETAPRRGEPEVSAVQYAELSRTTRDSRRAWERMLRWYGGCVTPMTQLISTNTVSGVGDEAMLFHLRSWRGSGETYVVGVARTGQIVTTTLRRTTDTSPPDLRDDLRLLGGAVNGLCATTPNARCSSNPKVRPTAPVRVSDVPGLLVEADLPPVTGVSEPWVGIPATEARTNTASTRCDRADFAQPFISNAVTRTFLVPRAKLPAAFGLTETVGTMPEARAKAFVGTIRDRMASCPDRDLGSDVSSITTIATGSTDLSLWRVTSEVSDDQTVTYLMGIIRRGERVGQVGFVPAPGVSMQPGAFDALLRRALARLEYLPLGNR